MGMKVVNNGEVLVGQAAALADFRRGDVLDIVVTGPGIMCARPHHDPALLDLASMTWSCMVCGDMRPDPLIAVAHRKVQGLEHMFPAARVNVRYCTDRPTCTAEATDGGVWQWRTRDDMARAAQAAATPPEAGGQDDGPSPQC